MTESEQKLKGKVALITGASRGIGAAVAREYARQGAHVILLARTLKDLEAVDDAIRADGSHPATIVPLDLRDMDKIDAMVMTMAERFKRLDILVGNAGMLGGLRPINSITNKQWDQALALNLTVNFRLLRACDPLLRHAEQGRAIFVTSGISRHLQPYWGLLATTKSALESMVRCYAMEVANTNICANLIDPGEIDSKFLREAYPGLDESNELPKPESIVKNFVTLAEDQCKYHGIIMKVAPQGMTTHVVI